MRHDARTWIAVSLLAASLTSGCAREPATPADVLFVNGRIYTLAGEPPADPGAEPAVEALAVRSGRIVASGTTAEVQRHAGPATRLQDLHGATAVPGLVDAHLHLAGLGRWLREVDLVGTTSYDEVVARVRDRAARSAAGDWIGGRGWDQNDWPATGFPDHAALSQAVPQHPVYLRRVDGHAALVNARALEIAGVGARTADPPGGRIERRPDGTPSGVLVDAAMDLVARHIPPPSPEERRLRLELALRHCAEAGLTGVHDAGMAAADLEICRALLVAGALPLRVYVMVDAAPDGADSAATRAVLEAGPQAFDPTLHLAARCVKLVADGALGSRGAALLEPYTDDPGHRGLPQYTPEAFLVRARSLHERGFQLATHCIGDAANRMVLDAYAQLAQELPRPEARFRIEHAQVLAPADIPRFAALGVLPSMQPTHCTSDMPWAGARLGSVRLRGAYAWRALRDTGVVIAAGSDAPVEAVAPRLGLYAAVTRQDAAGQPPEAWAPEQRLTRSEALRAFTAWAARASFTEDDLGTLEPGKLADLTVFDADPLRVPAPQLLRLRVLGTYVGGEAIHAVGQAAR
jgi:predicted amidohydrolase YtcJ